MAINCCKGCVAPVRHIACHATCEKYLAEKEAHDKRKAELDKERMITQAINSDRAGKVYNALKGYRGNKYRER